METNQEIETDMINFLKVQQEAARLRYEKVKAYGIKAYEDTGVFGITMRLHDKLRRIISFYEHKNDSSRVDSFEKMSESVRDSLIDISNYSMMAVMLLDKDLEKYKKRSLEDSRDMKTFDELIESINEEEEASQS